MFEGDSHVLPNLVELRRWWSSINHTPNAVPLHRELNPAVFERTGFNGMVHIVDTSNNDPGRWLFRMFSRRVAAAGVRDYTGQRLGQVPWRNYRDAVIEDYYSAATMGTPRIQEIDATAFGQSRLYQRIILPFSGKSGLPDRLLVAVAYKTIGLGPKTFKNLRS